MKKTLPLLALCGLVLVTSSLRAQESLPPSRPKILPSAGSANTSPVTAKDQRDLAGYAIGYDFAARLRHEGADINIEALIRGAREAFSGAEPAFTPQQLSAAMEGFNKDMQEKNAARFKQISEKNKRDGAAFLTANKLKQGVRALPSGLQYQVLKSGVGRTPTTKDKIKASYHGTLLDGTVFDSTQESMQPLEIAMDDVIDGWKEALQMMKTGDKWRLFVPSALAYGEQGYGPVPPNAVLIFDLELLDIVKDTGTAKQLPPATTLQPK